MVYVVQASAGKDLSAAAEFGTVRYLLSGPDEDYSPAQMVSVIRKGLTEFTDDDYLLPLGNPVAIGIATALAVEENYGRIRFLKWDRRSRRYLVVSIDIN